MKTYASLRASVLQALDAEGVAEDEAQFPNWLTLAESDIYNTLRAGWMVRRGTAIFADEVVDTPPSLVQMLGVSILVDEVTDEQIAALALVGSGGPAPSPPMGYPDRDLTPLGPEQVADELGIFDRRQLNGYGIDEAPRAFCVEGNTIRLVPWPGRPVWASLTYYSSGKRLVAGADTNDTLTRLPSAYYYGVLRHAAIWHGDLEGSQRWNAALSAALNDANSQAYGFQGTGIVARRSR